MKQFIVLAAVLPIMVVFSMQFALEAGRQLRMSAAENAVRAFCIDASYYNGGGPAEAEALKARLAQIFRANERDVYVELWPTSPNHIDWRVSFPVGEIMAGARLMGLSPAENRGRAQMSGTIVIAPEPPEPVEPETPGADDARENAGRFESSDTPADAGADD